MRSCWLPWHLDISGVAEGDFKPQELANTAWAVATVVQADAKLFATWHGTDAELQVGDFKPQELANTAWAVATVVQADAKLFATLALAQELASILGAWRR